MPHNFHFLLRAPNFARILYVKGRSYRGVIQRAVRRAAASDRYDLRTLRSESTQGRALGFAEERGARHLASRALAIRREC